MHVAEPSAPRLGAHNWLARAAATRAKIEATIANYRSIGEHGLARKAQAHLDRLVALIDRVPAEVRR